MQRALAIRPAIQHFPTQTVAAMSESVEAANDSATHRPCPSSVDSACRLLTIFGTCQVLFSGSAIPTGLFSGPHVLAVGILSLGLGTTALVASRAVARGSRLGWMGGMTWSAANFAASLMMLVAFVKSGSSSDWPAALFSVGWSMISVASASLLLRSKSRNWLRSAN